MFRLPRQPRDQARERPDVEGAPEQSTSNLPEVPRWSDGGIPHVPAACEHARLGPLSPHVDHVEVHDRVADRRLCLLLVALRLMVLSRIPGSPRREVGAACRRRRTADRARQADQTVRSDVAPGTPCLRDQCDDAGADRHGRFLRRYPVGEGDHGGVGRAPQFGNHPSGRRRPNAEHFLYPCGLYALLPHHP